MLCTTVWCKGVLHCPLMHDADTHRGPFADKQGYLKACLMIFLAGVLQGPLMHGIDTHRGWLEDRHTQRLVGG